MKIGINLSIVRHRGAKNYLYGFIPALGKIGHRHKFLVFVPEEEIAKLGPLVPPNFELRGTRFKDHVWKRTLWEQFILPIVLKVWRADVLFAPFEIAPLLFEPTLLAIRNPLALLMKTKGIEWPIGRTLKNKIQVALSSLSCRRAKIVFYPSQYASDQIGEIMSVPIAKRRVVYHGVQSELWSNIKRDSKVFEKYGVQPRKYFLFVSTMYQYKHPEVLLLAFARIRALGSYVDQRILLVGEFQDRRVESYLTKMIVETGMEDIARVTGGVPIAELGCLYEGCTAFVMPTTMETFGHMYLEAMSAGAPVICADMPFAREVCGEAAWYFAPMDDEGCARLMLRSMKDDDGTAILRAAGAMQTRKYSWRREATETLELLRQLAR